VKIKRGDPIPANAVESGLTKTGGICFVGRYQGQAGKIITREAGVFWNFWVHDTGVFFSATAKTEAEILVALDNAVVEWKPLKRGDPLPPVGTVQAGVTKNDGVVYVGRHGAEAGKINTQGDGKMHRFWGYDTNYWGHDTQEAEILLVIGCKAKVQVMGSDRT